MRKFNLLDGLVVPLDRRNVDTDAIIPKQFLKSIKRSGFGPNLFDDWRYLDHGEPGMDNSSRPLNPDFVLNFSRYKGAEVLLTRSNFGCGSSREHAPWALEDYGIRSIIASSYADIFYNNCFKNGILPVILKENEINRLFVETLEIEHYRLKIDLSEQTISLPDGDLLKFEIDTFKKKCLLEGLDDIGQTLKHKNMIRDYEAHRQQLKPWLFLS
jgi:3-isopropylmalate/(R)-2-methylmalate dehydratase small subunit